MANISRYTDGAPVKAVAPPPADMDAGPETATPPGGRASSELDYVPLFLDFHDRYSELTYEERGRLVWAMLAYARGEDPAPHLTEELRRFSFPNERDVIDRTEKVHVERKERRKAASQVAVAARTNRNESSPIVTNRNESSPIVTNRNESSPIVTNRDHNNNNNYNHNNNYNNNNNNNDNDNKGGSGRTHGKDRRSEAGRAVPVGRETIL